MKPVQINTKYKTMLARILSLSMIAVFIILGIIIRPASFSKSSETLKYEKAKKNYAESDFFLFEEDDEFSDNSEDGQEWQKDFSVDTFNRSLHISFASLNQNKGALSLRSRSITNAATPLFISIRALRI